MIRSTFSILQGIGEKTEKKLWGKGILTWHDFLAADTIDFIAGEKKIWFDSTLQQVLKHLEEKNSQFFTTALRPAEHWRLFCAFMAEAVALDIETSGYAPHQGGYATVVGLYDGFDYRSFVKGNGLTRKNLEHELSRYKYLITFFGSAFDLPFLRETLGIQVSVPHFDLCFSGRRAGFKGGLKKVEERLGINRDASVRGFDGFDAVRLWAQAARGRDEALELLVTYNRCDTVNLFELADIVYERLKERTGIADFMR